MMCCFVSFFDVLNTSQLLEKKAVLYCQPLISNWRCPLTFVIRIEPAVFCIPNHKYVAIRLLSLDLLDHVKRDLIVR